MPDWEKWIADRSLEMLDMPSDFGLDVVDDGQTVTLTKNFEISLMFTKQADASRNEACLIGLRESVWQALELLRLGLPLGYPRRDL